MPRVRRRVLVTFDAPADRVVNAADTVFAKPIPTPIGVAPVEREVVESTGSTTVLALALETDVPLPFFRRFMMWPVRLGLRRSLEHQADRLRAELAGTEPPRPPRRSPLLPPISFTTEAAALVATVAAIAAVANFGGALFGQNADSVTDAFGEGNRELGIALAVSRVGVLVSLVATALADRHGRRQIMLTCFAGVCIANAVSALAPTFAVFTAAQLLTRAFVSATLVVAAIAVIEEAPDGARAWSLAMLALAGGAGFAIAVVLLPLADIGTQGWRVAFGISALALLLRPRFARALQETRRYTALAARKAARGRLGELFVKTYGWRFVLVAVAAFLTNLFSAPSAQLTNRFLTDEHGFSNLTIAVFRAVTNGAPGFLGIVIAGWLAETRGRRPVGIIALALTSALQMAFFLGSGATLWITSTLAIVAAACAGLALGAFGTELFPTEVRGTSNALLLVCGVTGSATGLLLATNLDTVVGGLGPAIALCGIAPLIAAFLVLPFLPEPAHHALDEVSPSEV